MIKIDNSIETKKKRYSYYRVWVFQKRKVDVIYRAHKLNANQANSDIIEDFKGLEEHFKTHDVIDADRSLDPNMLESFIDNFRKEDFVIFARSKE